MNNNIFKEGDVYICDKFPYKSRIISSVHSQTSYGEDSVDMYFSIVEWNIYDKCAFDEKICQYKRVKSIEELLASGRSTYPFAINGASDFMQFKSYIKNNNMYKL